MNSKDLDRFLITCESLKLASTLINCSWSLFSSANVSVVEFNGIIFSIVSNVCSIASVRDEFAHNLLSSLTTLVIFSCFGLGNGNDWICFAMLNRRTSEIRKLIAGISPDILKLKINMKVNLNVLLTETYAGKSTTSEYIHFARLI